MRVLGLISGTSHDGIDSAVVDFDALSSADAEHGLSASVRHHASAPYDAPLRERLVGALPPAQTTLAEVARLDTEIGQAFADAAVTAIEAAGPVDLVVSHGQTVFHWVSDAEVLGTLQLGQAAWIAERTGAPVLSDVRIRDIAAGGQGAPLASTIDALLLAGRGSAGALNLGGISNVTVVSGAVDPGSARAWDIGPANALIDAVVVDRGLHPDGYDAGGAIAASGTVDEELLSALLADPYYRLSPPKSTGKELFHLRYVQDALGGREPSDADLVATLTELTVRTVVEALRPERLDELFVSGGGVHNDILMSGLAKGLPGTRVGRTDDLGIGADEKEAVLMALLGHLTWHGAAGNVPSATGAAAPRTLGTLTPGAEPLRLPEPMAAPTFLRVRTERT
ncbi:anhydro-N-acetylmuramic acid kinase [Microbacterium halotolerans]|uniref:anhydro-N-acetylmuramic acid kinase n=1 Tax=Microbacterium halotolerans TaxID=246613 RepID=UPI000E6AA264|nr:anhydro-N-acetylmuramic acid kinase [Microbacterium halotolerans]